MIIKTNQPLIHDREKMTRTIARFWNQISDSWHTIWGAHIHHGYYEEDQPINPKAAQEKLIEKLVDLLKIAPQDKILDIGCGMGGSSLYLAKHYHTTVTGITFASHSSDLNI